MADSSLSFALLILVCSLLAIFFAVTFGEVEKNCSLWLRLMLLVLLAERGGVFRASRVRRLRKLFAEMRENSIFIESERHKKRLIGKTQR